MHTLLGSGTKVCSNCPGQTHPQDQQPLALAISTEDVGSTYCKVVVDSYLQVRVVFSKSL